MRSTNHGRTARVRPLLLLVAALAGRAVLAQSATSVLTGNVVDASTRAPVGDVVVTATSPGLQGEQVVVTDATGLYRIPQLPPGTYTLRFEKETYRPFTRGQIDVPADRTLRLNVELLPETAGTETIAVVGTPPIVDVGSSTIGNTINQDFVRNLAVSRAGGLGGSNRSFDSLALTAPQAAGDLYGVSLNGATSPENSYLIDGLSVNDPAYGVNGSPLTVEFLDEVNVITGGYMPEYGRATGGTLSAVTKSGGNEFHGSIFGTWTPGALQGRPKTITVVGASVNAVQDLNNIGDLGATLGGYIIKDRLWFFAGIQYSLARYSYRFRYAIGRVGADGNQANDENGIPIFDPIAGAEQRRFANERAWNYIGKLTYLINSDHRVSIAVNGTPTNGGGSGNYSLRFPGALQNRAPLLPGVLAGGTFEALAFQTTDSSFNVNGELNSSFLDKRVLLDVRLGWHHQLDEGAPSDGSGVDDVINAPGLASVPAIATPFDNYNLVDVNPNVPRAVREACTGALFKDGTPRCGAGAGYLLGGPGFLERLKLDSYQAKATLTVLANALGHHVVKAGFDGQLNYYDHLKTYSGGAAYNDQGGGAVYREARRYGYQTGPDQIAGSPILEGKSKTVTVGGFAQDSWTILDKVTLNAGLRWDSQSLYGKDGALGIKFNNEWSPRIGLVFDPTQQGRSKIFANYGRYYENVPLDLADRALSVESQLIANHACNPLVDKLAGCDAKTTLRPSNFVRPANKWRGVGSDKTAVDPDLEPAANDEIVAGGEYEVIPNGRLGLTYTYRNLVRTLEDMSADNGNTYFIGNPGSGIARNFPKAERTYHAVTLQFTKSFSDLWLAQASYTWSRLRGNYDGLFRAEDGQLDPNINSTFDLTKLLLNQSGPLNGDVTHVLKAFISKEFVVTPVFSVTLGGSVTAASGGPINYLGDSNETGYGPRQVYILQRGQGGRLPWITSFDGRINLNYRVTKDSTVTLGVEAFNILNSQRPATVSGNYIGGAGNAAAVDGSGRDPGPIVNGTNGSIPSKFGAICQPDENAPTGFTCAAQGNGSLPSPRQAKFITLPNPDQGTQVYQINPNWARPTTYQPVRSFRFSARFTF